MVAVCTEANIKNHQVRLGVSGSCKWIISNFSRRNNFLTVKEVKGEKPIRASVPAIGKLTIRRVIIRQSKQSYPGYPELAAKI